MIILISKCKVQTPSQNILIHIKLQCWEWSEDCSEHLSSWPATKHSSGRGISPPLPELQPGPEKLTVTCKPSLIIRRRVLLTITGETAGRDSVTGCYKTQRMSPLPSVRENQRNEKHGEEKRGKIIFTELSVAWTKYNKSKQGHTQCLMNIRLSKKNNENLQTLMEDSLKSECLNIDEWL